MKRLKGFVDLVFDAVEETTNLVERTHRAVARRSLKRFAPIEPVATPAHSVNAVHEAVAAGVYESIRLVNHTVRTAVDLSAAAAVQIDPTLPESLPRLATPHDSRAAGSWAWVADFAEATINGWSGDYLSRRGNGLDLGMTVRHHGHVLPLDREAFAQAFPEATSKVCVFVHGLSSTEWLWNVHAEAYYGDASTNFGTQLARDHGYTPIYLRYNSGRHVSENGRALCQLLDQLMQVYPLPIEELALVGHSMGGLVSRSAANCGAELGASWIKTLQHIVCLGSPHLGAPLEKAANLLSGVLGAVPTAATQVIAELLNSRSSGIKDLRFGYMHDDEWAGQDPDALLRDNRLDVPLLEDVAYYFVGGTITADPTHPAGVLMGDLLVRTSSAAEPKHLSFRSSQVVGGTNHLDIANHPAVYEALRGWLG